MKTIELWYPNYQNNPGVLSKVLREQINEQLQNFDRTIEKTYFEGYEKYIVELEGEPNQYDAYIQNSLQKRYGMFPKLTNIQSGDSYIGRLIEPGKVGFGLFVDIGIRKNGPHDCLWPLFQLRDDLNQKGKSLRETIKYMGAISGLPLEFEILGKEEDKVSVKLAASSIDWYHELLQGPEKLVITKTLYSKIEKKIHELSLHPYIQDIVALDPLTTVIFCQNRTRATGLIPRLGPKFPNAPMGVIRPSYYN